MTSALRSIKKYLRPFKVFYQRRKNRVKRSPINKNNIKILFVVQRIECFNSSLSVYLRMIKDDSFDVTVLSLPKFLQFSADRSNKFALESLNDIFKFCESLPGNHKTINSYNHLMKSYIIIEEYSFDYIFVNIPYEEQYPEEVNIKRLNKIGRICYLPYGYNSTKNSYLFEVTNPIPSLNFFDIYYAINKKSYGELLIKRMWVSQLLSRNKPLRNMGYPRFDLLDNASDRKGLRTLLWLPRWETSLDIGHEQSTFLAFKEDIVSFAEMNPAIEVIIRPHPLMFENHIKAGKISREELEHYFNRINSIPNISFDKNDSYEKTLDRADLILSDFTGLLVEMFVMGKKVAYTGEKGDLKKEFYPMIDSFYEAKTWEQFLEVFQQLSMGVDNKKQKRDAAIKKFWTFNVSNAAVHIVDDIKRRCDAND